jgi:1,2-diacylglycerol 3-alpha-glucosyltransferase
MKCVKHILLLTPGFPADENDSTCLPMIQEFLNGFQKLHSEVSFTVVSLHYPYHTTPYNWNGINVIPLGGSNIKGFAKLMFWRNAIKKVYDINSKNKYDLVHSFWLGEATMIALRAGKKFSIPCLSTIMGQDALPENNYLPFIDFDHLKVVALCERQADILWKTTGRKVSKIIPWGINDQSYNPKDEREIDILGVGSLIPLKNYEEFIRIIGLVRENVPEIKVEIVGQGIEREHLEELIAKLNLEKNINLSGEISHDDILKKMKKSKIFLHTSLYEGFGFVFAEALSNGMYVFSGSVGAAAPSEKWIIAENNEQFSSAIQQVLNKKMNFEPDNNFSINNTIKSYLDLYN